MTKLDTLGIPEHHTMYTTFYKTSLELSGMEAYGWDSGNMETKCFGEEQIGDLSVPGWVLEKPPQDYC